jgi:uncharacterized membrane protein YfcA
MSMSYIVICGVACLASGLTFLSGFGLGTLLLPAFALFFPVEQAVALTAVVHFLNGLFKLALVGRSIAWPVALRFGLPAIAGGIVGALLLEWLAVLEPLATYDWLGKTFAVMPVKLAIGVLLVAFALLDVLPGFRDLAFGPGWMPVGGILSGFFGGLSGMQGALRSAFLSRAGLSKEGFVATAAVIAALVDVSRLGVYGRALWRQAADLDLALLAAAVAAAFAGAVVGRRVLRSVTMEGIRNLVAGLLVVVGIGLAAGLL